MTDDDDIRAAEIALGLIEDDDPTLAVRVSWWRDQFTALVPNTAPPPQLWSRIESALPVNDNDDALLQRWRAVALSAMAVAAALLIFIGLRPVPVIAPPASPMVATLSGEKGAIVTVSYDGTSGRLTVAPSVLDPGRGDAELWIIPEDGTPRSLGVIDARATLVHQVAENRRNFMHPGATFAISQEVKGGSPTGTPTGTIVATGKIIRA